MDAEGAHRLLSDFRDQLAGLADYSHDSVEQAMRSFVEQREIKMRDLVHPVRLAVTGKAVGFGLFETLAILGQSRVLARIGQALERFPAAG